jgi:hypothetical protein
MATKSPGINSVDQKCPICYNSSIVNKKELEMNTYQVSYTAYVGRSSEVLAEGTMQIQANQASQAENVVKSMFQGSDVIIRSVFG